MNFTVATSFTISAQDVANLVTMALEGISNEWLGQCEPAYAHREDYSEADRYGLNMIARTFSLEEDDETCVFDLEAIKMGLQIMADRFPSDFNDLREGTAEAYTADVFMQCALLGDVIYG